MTATWYLVHCKSRQDERAEEHLRRQGFTCYRPRLARQRLVRGRMLPVEESLFPGYIFVWLEPGADRSTLRSTRGVLCLVSFGGYPLSVPSALVEALQSRTGGGGQEQLQAGDKVRILEGAFADLDAIFQCIDGEGRAVLLMNVLSRQQCYTLPLTSVRKV
ncbi:transcription/translation regulatory transformer protein RfaH [Pseudomonas soli]|uniref:transcription/translation regulatory transformer protein RfaH n=1 Tax=Pseudomonas soli TaxID=1306993 RepID=UPI0028AF23A7|nr:transcription/translation regulatory transformer protein RfaH [Pseudomonas soli]